MTTAPETDAEAEALFDAALRALAAKAATRYPGETDRVGRGLLLALNGHVALGDDGSALVRSGRDAEVVYRIAHGTCDCRDAAVAPSGRCKHLYAAVLVRRARYGMTPLEKALEPLDGVPEPALDSIQGQAPDGVPEPALDQSLPRAGHGVQGQAEAGAPSTELPEGHELPPLAPSPSRDEEAPSLEKEDELMPFLPEAGASLNIKLKFGSSEVMYTARGHSDAEVLARLPGILAGVEKALARHDEAEAGFFTRLTRAFWPRQRHDTTGEQGA